MRFTESLEKVEKEATITYKDCAAKYLELSKFLKYVEDKGGMYHEDNYNDCLKFV